MIQVTIHSVVEGSDPPKTESAGTFTLKDGKIITDAAPGYEHYMSEILSEPLANDGSVTADGEPAIWLRMLPDQYLLSTMISAALTGAEPILWKYGG